MRLSRLVIEGFRSIRERVVVPIDTHVTVILGANDHGKSNVLEALAYLDPRTDFVEDDLNWDRSQEGESLPFIQFVFTLNADERHMLADLEDSRRIQVALEPALATAAAQANELASTLVQAKRAAGTDASRSNSLHRRISALRQRRQVLLNAGRSAKSEQDTARAERLLAANGESLQVTEAALPAVEQAAAESERIAQDASEAHAEAFTSLGVLKALSARSRLVASGLPDFNGVQAAAALARSAADAAREDAEERAAESRAAEEALDRQIARTRARRNAQLVRDEAARAAAQAARRASSLEGRARRAEETAELVAEVLTTGTDPMTATSNLPGYVPFQPDGTSSELVLTRHGLAGDVTPETPAGISPDTIGQLLERCLPHVEMIPAVSRLSNTVSLDDIDDEDQTFMRGLFYYAGLDRERWSTIFEQNPRTIRALREASANLTRTLQESWSQGKDLEFILTHSSTHENAIELTIQDPSVEHTDVRVSKRSTGFTHFFWLKTVLHAREIENPAASYVWLFDEPGAPLHPDGQRDLVQEFETIARTNQVLYSTHSVFMLNKNFPARHRLIRKTERGTQVDVKPYGGRWQAAREALGLGLPGTVLFAGSVLLVEGDSDPVLLNKLLQTSIELGLTDLDINSLSVIATGESRHAEAITRILLEAPDKPRIVALFDSDGGGRRRHTKFQAFAKRLGLFSDCLDEPDLSLEDYLPALDGAFVPAVAEQAAEAFETPVEEATALATDSWQKKDASRKAADWSRQDIPKLFDKDGEVLSSLGIARRYVEHLDAIVEKAGPQGFDTPRVRWLLKFVEDNLGLPRQVIEHPSVFEEPRVES